MYYALCIQIHTRLYSIQPLQRTHIQTKCWQIGLSMHSTRHWQSYNDAIYWSINSVLSHSFYTLIYLGGRDIRCLSLAFRNSNPVGRSI